MRIALVCHRFHPHIGGVELHVKEIAERFARNSGNSVTVFTLEDDKTIAPKELMNRVAVMRYKPIRLSEAVRIPPSSMVNDIKAFQPDIVHVHNIHSLLPYFASKASTNAKLLFTPHYIGNSLTSFRRMLFKLYKPFLTKVMYNADRIVCISDVEKSMLLRDFAIDKRKMVIIPNGVDAELTQIIPKRNDLRILSVGRLDLVHKKTDKLVRAFKLLEGRFDGKLVLVGDGPDKDKILSLIGKLMLQERIELKSNLTKAELFDEYSRASIFVMASENETYGIVVAEALAAGLKVVVPKASGLALFVDGGFAIGITPPVTPEKIANTIMNVVQALSSNSNNTNSISSNYPDNISTQRYTPHTWDMVAAELEQLYHQLS